METIIKDFKKLSVNGSVFLTKIGDAFVVSIRRFDPATGKEVTPDVFALDPAVLDKLEADTSAIIENISLIKEKMII